MNDVEFRGEPDMTTKPPRLLLLILAVAVSAIANAMPVRTQSAERQAQLYVLNEVAFVGTKSLSTAHLLAASKLKRECVVTDADVSKSSSLVRGTYLSKGFIRARITPSKRNVGPLAVDGPLRIDLVFNVEEGPQFLIRVVELMGNRVTSDRTVLRSIGVRPWDPYDPKAVEVAIKRLNRIRTLDVVKKEDIEIEFDESKHMVDLRFHLKEKL